MTVPSTERGQTSRAGLLAFCLVSLMGANARAYQNPMRFADPPEMGGGGGRFFTGSPGDSYTCVVCHTPGTPPHLKVMGLPVNGYVPGQTYRITVDWDDALKSVALDLEITDTVGQTLGSLAVPKVTELSPGDLCGMQPDVAVATLMPNNRQLAVVTECGGHQMTLDWTAPLTAAGGASAPGPAWFSGSLVSGDADGTIAGDSVTDFTHVLSVQGQPEALPSKLAGSCAAVRVGARSGPGALMVLGGLLALMWRRRRR